MRTPVAQDDREIGAPEPIPASEQGYVMLIAIFLIALLVISLAVAAPKMARSIQRDRDVETFHRGMQYRRAIQLYYRKFHAYPPNVEALVNTNDIRFLRKKYIDPMTGQADWKPITFGQNKTPTAMGFFGQPLSGNAATLAGIGPSGGNTANPSGSAFGGNPAGGGFSSGSLTPGLSDTSDQSSTNGSTSSPGDTTDTSGNAAGGGTSTGGVSSTGSSSGSTSGSGGPTFGGAGIIGFEPASPKQSILIYKKKQHYNEWEFTYDPLSDMKTIGGGNTGLGGAGTNGTGTSGIGTNGAGTNGTGTTGGSAGSGSFGNSNPTPIFPPDSQAPQ
ncbi:MAG TPA: type II secretion system protein [Terracidiphilus sp.]|jgi:type II secretory pathway pseudopilin PulG